MNIDLVLKILILVKNKIDETNNENPKKSREIMTYLISDTAKFFYSVKHTCRTILENIDGEENNDNEEVLTIIRGLTQDLLKKCEEDK